MDTKYPRFRRYVTTTPWAVRPWVLAVITELLAYRAAGGRLSREEIEERIGARQPTTGRVRSGSLAVIPLHGVIVHRADLFSDISGASSIERFRARLNDALADDSVASILIDIDSPGGTVDGLIEMAEELRQARGGEKPIRAIANTEAASAAYWLGAQAGELIVSPSGEIGSIGVWSAHIDQSKYQEAMGVKTTLVSAGRYKVEGNPFEPLGEEARASMQESVDRYHTQFVADVAKGRGVSKAKVEKEFGEGRMVGPAQALAAGMVDRVASFEETLSRLRGVKRSTGNRSHRFRFSYV